MESNAGRTLERPQTTVIPFPGQTADTPYSRPADVLPDEQGMEGGRTYTFKQAADLLQCGDESTLRNRYWKEKIEPAFRHCPIPLDLFRNKKNRQVNLSPALGGWILDILNP